MPAIRGVSRTERINPPTPCFFPHLRQPFYSGSIARHSIWSVFPSCQNGAGPHTDRADRWAIGGLIYFTHGSVRLLVMTSTMKSGVPKAQIWRGMESLLCVCGVGRGVEEVKLAHWKASGWWGVQVKHS